MLACRHSGLTFWEKGGKLLKNHLSWPDTPILLSDIGLKEKDSDW